MKTPKTPQDWASYYGAKLQKRQAAQAREAKAAARARKGKDVAHPLLSAPGHVHYQREAERHIEARRQAERHRGSQVHPMVYHGHIPVPPQPERPKRK